MKKFKEILEQSGAGDWGTDKARKRLQDDTPGQDSLDEVTTSQLIRRLVLAPKMKKMVRFYLDWRRENPGKGNMGVQKVIQMMGLNPRDGNQLIDTLNDLIKQGKLPKHLALNPGGIKEEVNEKLKVSDGLGAWIADFQDSDAPQFKNADSKKRRDMAIAAFTDAGGKLEGTFWGAILEAIEEGSETWEAGYKRRVVKTTKPEHKEKGYNWRIKGKDKAHLTIKLYKEKPSQAEFNKQMKRVAGHEFGG